MHGWIFTIALATLQTSGSSSSGDNVDVDTPDSNVEVGVPDAVANATNSPETDAPDSSSTAGDTPATSVGDSSAPASGTPDSAPTKTDEGLSEAAKQRVALEYRADRAFERGDYWKAATIWARLAGREDGPSNTRDHYVLRAIAASELMFDEYGERRALCFAHRLTSTHLRAGRSEGQAYFVRRRRALATQLKDQIGERWPYACRQLLRESSFGESPSQDRVQFFGGPTTLPEELIAPHRVDCPPDTPQPPDGGCGSSFPPPLDDKPETSRRPLLIAGTTVTATGAATLLATAATGFFYNQELIDLRAWEDESEKRQLTAEELAMAEASMQRADKFRTAAIATGIAGGAQVVAGITMLIVDAKRRRKTRSRRLSFAPAVGVDGAGWLLRGHF